MTSTTSLLTRFQRILVGTDGTVTHILEAFADEPIEARKLSQELDAAGPGEAPLELPVASPVLRREVVLRGQRSGRNLLYAQAVVVAARVHLDLLNALLSTDVPIGRLLAQHRVETFREILSVTQEPAGACAAHFGIGPTDELVCRTYRIVSRGQPIMLITERFPSAFFRGLPA